MNITAVFSGFSVDDIPAATKFYAETLGLDAKQSDRMEMPLLDISLPNGGQLMVYPKPDHQPATYTVLNLVVDDIDAAVDELAGKGVKFESYTEGPIKTDAKGVARGLAANMGPDIAWFKDPAGNILAVLQDK